MAQLSLRNNVVNLMKPHLTKVWACFKFSIGEPIVSLTLNN